MSELIVIASGKGGVGKTTLSANLSACLADRGKSVLVIDCDVCLRNLDIYFGVQDHIWDSGDVFSGHCSLSDAIIADEKRDDLFILPAPAHPTGNYDAISAFIIKTALEKKQTGEYDYVVVDCPSGLMRGVDVFFRHGVRVIVVATPDLTSIHDAEAVAVEAYERGVTDISLVVNRVRPKAIDKGKAPDIDDIIDRVSVRLLGLIPEDRKTSEATNTGCLIVDTKKARSKRAYINIAARIDGEFTELYSFR